jgi:indole-3-glycerol phosphate synthase
MTFLEELVDSTRRRIGELHELVTPEALEQRIASVETPRGFHKALARDDVAIVAEIKRATPSKGLLRADLNAGATARAYAAGGAAAISVVTEPKHFQGTIEDFTAARGAGLPVLRKDFILDPMQVFEARAWGADAVLLIVRILSDDDLTTLMKAARSLGIDALVEVFDEADLERAASAGAKLIGVNHRDLDTFEVDDERTAKLAPRMPDDAVLVALSGVSNRADVEALAAAGADAVLVGEHLVTAEDPAAAVRSLRGVA